MMRNKLRITLTREPLPMVRFLGFGCFLLFVLMGCTTTGPSTLFEEPKEMEPMVTFWEKVYSKWDEDTVVFHDNTYMDLIYSVERLPRSEREVIQAKKEYLAEKLAHVDEKITLGLSLNQEERKLYEVIKKHGYEHQIFGIAERLRVQRGLKNRFKRGLEASTYYLPRFEKAFTQLGFPKELAYLPHVESSFQNHARSSVGAGGMWQFMPRTAPHFMPMKKGVYDGRFDPFVAAKGAANYLQESYELTGSWPLSLTSYNHGLTGVLKAQELYGDNINAIVWNYKGPRFGFASRNFYAEFLAAKRIAENPSNYFTNLTFRKPADFEGLHLLSPIKLKELAELLNLNSSTLITLNPAWLAPITENKIPIPSLTEVWVPKGTLKASKSEAIFTKLSD